MTTKSFQLDIAFMVTPMAKNEAQIMTMRLAFKAISSSDDFSVI